MTGILGELLLTAGVLLLLFLGWKLWWNDAIMASRHGRIDMYGALPRVLPGPAWLRVILLLVILIGLVAVLFTWVFPWVDGIINPIDVTVEQ